MGPLRRIALAGVVVGVAAAAGASVAGFVLADIFRPHALWVDLPSLPPAVQRSDRWTDWHQFASGLILASTAISFAVLLWLVYGVKRVLIRKAVAIAASALSLVMAGLTIITRPLVEWDQLALWSVTVGQDLGGYWLAGFDNKVRFVLIENQELSQGEYVQTLIVHLGAPIVGGVALMVVGAVLLRTPVPARRD